MAITLDDIHDWASDEAIVIDGFDEAIIGVTTEGNLIYSYDLMIEILVRRDEMDVEEAAEYIDYNVDRALPYFKEHRPVIAHILIDNEEEIGHA